MFIDILALNTFLGDKVGSNKRAYVINLRGGYYKLDFVFGNRTEADNSCSLQWRNQFYVFGGRTQGRQLSMVNGNRLERKATLDFDFQEGGCTVLNQQTIVLCFGGSPWKVCRQLKYPLGPSSILPETKHNYRYSRIAGFNGNSATR